MRYFEIESQVRFSETDEMGIVHHKNYFSWLEESRFAILKAASLDYFQIKVSGFGFVVRSVECEYLVPAKFADKLLIQTYLQIEKKSKFIFYSTIRRKNNFEILAKAKIISIVLQNNKICLSIPLDIKDKIIAFMKDYGWDNLLNDNTNGEIE
jgi:acyl-CoA thioester hydrolase